MSSSPLSKKLQIKAGYRGLILNAPDGYLEQLLPLPQGIELTEDPTGTFDLVHLFVRTKAELDEHAPIVLSAVKHDGLLWMSWPKRSSKVPTDLTRDVGWDSLKAAGWEGIATVSIDETWSALRFKRSETVRRSARPY